MLGYLYGLRVTDNAELEEEARVGSDEHAAAVSFAAKERNGFFRFARAMVLLLAALSVFAVEFDSPELFSLYRNGKETAP